MKRKRMYSVLRIDNKLIDAVWVNYTLGQKKLVYIIALALQSQGYTIDSFATRPELMPKKTKVLNVNTNKWEEEEISACISIKFQTKNIGLDYETLKDAIKQMQRTQLEYTEDKTTYIVSALPHAKLNTDGTGSFTISIYANVARLLLNFTKYTTMRLDQILRIKSKHTLRLYEMINKVKNQDYAIVKLNGLNEMNRIFDTKYKRIKDIHDYILIPAQKELKETNDLAIEIQKQFANDNLKKGRRPLVGYMLYVTKNTPQASLF